MRSNNQVQIYQAARQECEQIGAGQFANHSQVLPPPTFGTVTAASSAARYHAALNAPTNGYPVASGSGWRGPATAHASSSTRASWSSRPVLTTGEPVLADWKASPMWRPIKALTQMEALPGEGCSSAMLTTRHQLFGELTHAPREARRVLIAERCDRWP
jgi:E3 SUMO-protein ligase PIAS1